MRIHELAKLTGISARSLRYYEAQGLLKPRRSSNGYREYSHGDPAIASRIRWLLSAGLSTNRIREVLPCFLEEKTLQVECPALRKQFAIEIRRIEQLIAELRRKRDLLRSTLVAVG